MILPTRTKSGAQSSRSISWRPRCLALSRDTYVVCPKLNPKASVSCRQGQVTSPVCKARPFAALRKVGEDVRAGAEPILVRRWAPCLGELFPAKIFYRRPDQRQRFLVSVRNSPADTGLITIQDPSRRGSPSSRRRPRIGRLTALRQRRRRQVKLSSLYERYASTLGERFWIRPVAVTEPRIIWRDQMVPVGKPGEERLEHPR